ncbi:hypothetical protein QVD17_01158 [Tagetes erecta]|uniref:Uncharacterized protein n=1 Tax=Tagetes erecta TaxID=13708 RepID=A0AAD8LA38_TARER|nr:hypothetical protein QVD17_01158 [Tagetes erecta]
MNLMVEAVSRKSTSFIPKISSMYPKVKVIQQQQDDSPKRIYLYDHPSNSPARKDGYVAPYMRVPVFDSVYAESDADTPVKEGKVKKKVADEKKSNSKVTSVLPPRAVLSSPENDAMHGTKNKNKIKTQGTWLKKHNLCQNTHVKCKETYELEKRRPSWK